MFPPKTGFFPFAKWYWQLPLIHAGQSSFSIRRQGLSSASCELPLISSQRVTLPAAPDSLKVQGLWGYGSVAGHLTNVCEVPESVPGSDQKIKYTFKNVEINEK